MTTFADRVYQLGGVPVGGPVTQGGEILLQSRDESTGHYRGTPNHNPDLSPSLYS